MRRHSLSWLVKLFSGILVMLGLGSCATKKIAPDPSDQGVKEEIDPREDIGRMVVLYGGPPARFQEKIEQFVESDTLVKKE